MRGEGQFEAGPQLGGTERRPRIEGSPTARIREVEGVAAAEAYVQGYTRPIDKEGEPYGNPNFGAATFGASWGTVDELNPFNVVDGRAPEDPTDGAVEPVGGLDPDTAFDLFDVGVGAGDVSRLDADGIAVFAEEPEQRDGRWATRCRSASAIPATSASRSRRCSTARPSQVPTCSGIAAFDANLPNSGDNQVWIRLADGVGVDDARPAPEALLAGYPTAELQDLSEFKSATSSSST